MRQNAGTSDDGRDDGLGREGCFGGGCKKRGRKREEGERCGRTIRGFYPYAPLAKYSLLCTPPPPIHTHGLKTEILPLPTPALFAHQDAAQSLGYIHAGMNGLPAIYTIAQKYLPVVRHKRC